MVPQPPTHLLDLCHMGERAKQRLRLKLRRLGRCEGGCAIGQRRRGAPRRRAMRRNPGGPRQRHIGVPLRFFVVRLLGLMVGMRRRVLWWQGGKVRVPANVRGLPIPSGSLYHA